MTEVGMALLLHKGKILVAQRNPLKHLGGFWEFPGGKLEPQETLPECIKREFMEEFGKVIEVGDLFMEINHTYENAGDFHLSAFWAFCEDDSIPEVNEHMDYKWVTIPEMSKLKFCPADTPILEKLNHLAD